MGVAGNERRAGHRVAREALLSPAPSAASSARCAPIAVGCSHAPGPAFAPRPARRLPGVTPARRAVAVVRNASRIVNRFQRMDRMPKGRLAVPAQPMARPREHMSCMMRHPNRVQDRKTLLVRNKLQTRAALPVTQPIQLSCAAPCPAEAPVSEQPTIRPSRSRTRYPRLSPTGVDKPRQGNRSRTACGETVRSRCNLNRNNLQRRQRTRNRRGYRPVNVWPSPIRHSPTEAAKTRATQCRKPGQAFPRSSHAESHAAEVMTKRATKFLTVPLAGGVVDTASRKEGRGREGAIFSLPEFRPLRQHCGEGGVRRTWNFRKGGSDRAVLGVEP